MSRTTEHKASALERWVDTVDRSELVEIDVRALRRIATLTDRRTAIDTQLEAAVIAARRKGWSWSQIGLMLGVTKQAAQRKYASRIPAA